MSKSFATPSVGWDLHVAAAGRRRLRRGERLTEGANSVWCRSAPDKPWRLQLMLAEGDNHNWAQLGVSPQPRHRPTIGGGRTMHR